MQPQGVILFILLQLSTAEPCSINKNIKLTNETQLQIEIALKGFECKIQPLPNLSTNILGDIRIEYDSSSLACSLDYQKANRIGQLSIIGGQEEVQPQPRQGGEAEKSLQMINGLKNNCIMSFTPSLPIYLDMELGMGNSNIDLSGLKIAKLKLSVSGNTTLSFNSPNPIRCQEMYISAGISKFNSQLLGNAGFEVLYFNGRVGSYTIDLRGNFTGTKRVEITSGPGNIRLILPKKTGIRLKPTGFSIKSIPELKKDAEGWYQSDNWAIVDNKLIIHIDGSIGRLKVEFL